MKTIEKGKNYEFRLMPNPKNANESIQEVLSTVKTKNPNLVHMFFSYFLNDEGKIDVLKFGYLLKTYIRNCMMGFYGTSEGYYICEDKVKYYYANKDKSYITLDDGEFEDDQSDKKELYKYEDVLFYDRFIPFDIKSNYIITFKTRDRMGFMEMYNIGLKEIEPLYKDGDDKNKILSLYENAPDIKEVIENHKKELSENSDFEYLFDEEARKYYFNKNNSDNEYLFDD